MYRQSGTMQDTVMVLGKHDRTEDINNLNMLEEEENPVIKDHLEIYQTTLETLKKYSTMFVKEDYPAWKA